MKLPAIDRPAWLPYVLPMGLFLGLTALEAYLPKNGEAVDPTYYLAAYSAKAVAVTVAMVLGRSAWRDLKPFPGAATTAVSIALGLIVTALWVTIPSPVLPLIGSESARVGFDPGGLSAGLRVLFLVVRFYGLVLMVPIFEELFWRSFLWRSIVNPDFETAPIGAPYAAAAITTSALFALVHPEWVPALITGLLWGGLLWKTKSLSACVVSHMTANLGLGIYVMATGKWIYW